MSETNNQFTDMESTRRRSAMAHLKRAAAATKADKVLSHVVGRDAASDPEEQSPYRDDLAKVVRPRSGSRPISRPVSKDSLIAEPWDEGTSDIDAAMFAAASEQALATQDTEADHGIPAEEFAAEEPATEMTDAGPAEAEERFTAQVAPQPESPEMGDERVTSVTGGGIDESSSFDLSEDDFANSADDDDDGPVPSTAVAEALAIANGEMDFDDEAENDTGDDDDAIKSQLSDFAGDDAPVLETSNQQQPEPESFVNVATAVSAGRVGRSAGRVKTRLLGFQPGDEDEKDIFEAAKEGAAPAATEFPVGWIVVIEGPGRGKCFTLFNGVSNIGRGEDQAVRLDFGDTSISRNNHAAVAFDDEQGKFFLGHGGKSNLVRLNGKPVLSTEEMATGDEIRIGETALKFMPLCGPDFSWSDKSSEDQGVDG